MVTFGSVDGDGAAAMRYTESPHEQISNGNAKKTLIKRYRRFSKVITTILKENLQYCLLIFLIS